MSTRILFRSFFLLRYYYWTPSLSLSVNHMPKHVTGNFTGHKEKKKMIKTNI